MGIFAQYIAPSLGAILGVTMYMSPLPAILEVRKNQNLGQINPLPFSIIVGNCFGWCVYGVQKEDYYIFVANLIGAILGIFYSLNRVVYTQQQKIRDFISIILIIFPAIFGIEIFVLSVSNISTDTTNFVFGLSANIVLVIYYSAPLSVFYKVIKNKDSSSLYVPLILLNFLNGSMWFIYGLFAMNDPFIWIPNFSGMILSLISLILRVIFPKKISQNQINDYQALNSFKNKIVSQDNQLQVLEIEMNENVKQNEEKNLQE